MPTGAGSAPKYSLPASALSAWAAIAAGASAALWSATSSSTPLNASLPDGESLPMVPLAPPPLAIGCWRERHAEPLGAVDVDRLLAGRRVIGRRDVVRVAVGELGDGRAPACPSSGMSSSW
ncbi:MAG: hypothetical protein R3F11_27815 [Verrucomicrobiales bacterium]